MATTDRAMHNNPKALNEIRDNAIFLSLGNEYLNQEPILVKVGRIIDENVDKMREEITVLKRKFPGKYEPEIDTEDILESIRGTARILQQPDEVLGEKGRIGELGKGLENKIRELTSAIEEIRSKVEGGSPTYTVKDSFLGLFSEVSEAGRPLGKAISWTLKLLGVIVGISFLITAYLFITMDRESSLLEKIAVVQSEIQSRELLISDYEANRKEFVRKISEIEKKNMLRQEKIAIMDLEIKVHNLDEEIRKLQTEISVRRDRITDTNNKLDEIRGKSFWERLFKPFF
jgi:hypothetical protein